MGEKNKMAYKTKSAKKKLNTRNYKDFGYDNFYVINGKKFYSYIGIDGYERVFDSKGKEVAQFN